MFQGSDYKAKYKEEKGYAISVSCAYERPDDPSVM